MHWVGWVFSPPVFPLLTHVTSVSIVSSEGRGGEPRPVLHKKSEARGPGGLLVAGTRGEPGASPRYPPRGSAPRQWDRHTPGSRASSLPVPNWGEPPVCMLNLPSALRYSQSSRGYL